MNTHNIFFCGEIRKTFTRCPSYLELCKRVLKILTLNQNVQTNNENDSVFVLQFYGPVNPMGSCRARSVYLLWPSQPNGVMSSTISLPNHTLTGQA